MGANTSTPQNSATGSNTDQGPTSSTIDSDQFSYTQEANAQESCKPHVGQFNSVPRSHSVDNFETSVHASGQEPEYSPFPMPMPSIAGDAPRRNAKLNVDSHASPPPFPMPSYFSKPQYGEHANPIQIRRRHPSCPPSQSGHSQFGASPTPSRHHVRASTYPFPTPSLSFPIPQLVSGAYYC